MASIFENYPVIEYANNLATNLISRVSFNEVAKKTSSLFYPYTIENNERPDLIAANYYGDPKYSWLIYLSNNLFDPYYQWPLDENQLREHIVSKYGSFQSASKKIIGYKVNWEGDFRVLDASGYNALPSALKKYWTPLDGFSGIINYERSKIDLVLETNKIISLTVSNSTSFSVNDIVNQYTTTGNQLGQGHIKFVSNNNLIIQHISGDVYTTGSNVTIDSTTFIAGALTSESNTATTNVTSKVILNQPISNTEASYWSSVNALDYEIALNDSKKIIQLLDKDYVDQVENEITSLL